MIALRFKIERLKASFGLDPFAPNPCLSGLSSALMGSRISLPIPSLSFSLKVAQCKKLFCINSHHTAKLNFLFLSLFVYLFNKCFCQFLSHWELAKALVCSEELNCLHYKNKKQKPDS